jgi:hypothetical protein
MTALKSRQGGWSFLSLLTFLIVAGVFVSVAFKLVPAYTDHQTLKSIMQSTQLDRQLMSRNKREILRGIGKKMGINNMALPKGYLKITKDKGDVLMDIAYEIRIPIFMNVDAVVSFKEQYVGQELD